MSLLLVLSSLPCLWWPGGAESAPAVRQAAIERLCVPPESVEAWRKAGFTVTALSQSEFSGRARLRPPGIVARANVASPTRSPWVTANGWRFLRQPSRQYRYELPAGVAALAAAEAFAYGADVVLQIDPADLGDLGRMMAFLSRLPARDLPAVADLGVVDDGSRLTGEVMNLLARRNLLFAVVPAPAPQFRVNVKLGTSEYPLKEAADPSAFALRIRRQLTDEHRTLRLYGSEVVIARLTGDATGARLHLLNYGRNDIDGLRIRLRGAWGEGAAWVPGPGRVPLDAHVVAEGATEFTLPTLGAYAVIDLPAVN